MICRMSESGLPLLLTLAALVTCEAAPQQAAPGFPAPENGYILVFNDDFSTLDLSPNRSSGHTWYEGVWFNQKHAPLSNIHADSSILHLDWTRRMASRDTSITTLSKDKQTAKAWRYGYFEARMRWTAVNGAWPAFWLIPVQDADRSDVYNGVRESGEIDIFEGQGNHPHIFYGTLHDWVNNRDSPSRYNAFLLPNGVNFRDFHVYGLKWVPGEVTWYFDRVPLHSEPTPAILDRQDFFMILGMQEGVDWKQGDLTGVSANKLTLDVDWVRVWQKK